MTTISARILKSRLTTTITTTDPVGNGRITRPFLYAALLLMTSGCQMDRVSALRQQLAAQPSATAVLDQRCIALTGGRIQKIHAVRMSASDAPHVQDLEQRLGLSAGECVRVRHVSLNCENIVLSNAWNWYVPVRLTSSMNAVLENSDIPFGRAVHELGFRREPLHTQEKDLPPGVVFRNRGVLRRGGDDAPIAFVIEDYTAAALP